jgi:hypothetical protein
MEISRIPLPFVGGRSNPKEHLAVRDVHGAINAVVDPILEAIDAEKVAPALRAQFEGLDREPCPRYSIHARPGLAPQEEPDCCIPCYDLWYEAEEYRKAWAADRKLWFEGRG